MGQLSTAGISLPTNPWKLVLADPTNPIPALLWNGQIGVRFSRSGGGLGEDGKPLGFYMIDEYQSGGEEKIHSMPNPIIVTWSVGNVLFDGDKTKEHDFLKSGGTALNPFKNVSDYYQILDMKTGELVTRWTQATSEAGSVDVVCESVIHPSSRAIAQRWTITSQLPSTFSIKSLEYSGPNDHQEAIGGDSAQTITITASKSRAVVSQTKITGTEATAVSVGDFRFWEGKTEAHKPVVFERVLCFGPHSAQPLPEFTEKNIAKLKTVTPKPQTFAEVMAASKMAWEKRWKTDIVIDGPASDQAAIHSFLFYLRSSIAPGLAKSVSPFGLSDDQYSGHVFWDADIWVFPALALVDPEAAKSIAAYRIDKEPAGEANFRKWFKETTKTTATRPGVGLKYPWESSVTGLETAPGSSKQEDHVTGSVLWELTQASSLGLVPDETVDRYAALAANFYFSRGERNPRGKFEIKNVMSPDENHIGNNDLYTNLLANWLVTGRHLEGSDSSPPFVIPQDRSGLLTYDGDPLRAYKQAAAILAIYPLQYPPAESQTSHMMGRFESKVIPNGPAMSDSLNALIWARNGTPSKAYTDWHKSWQPFTNHPFMLFSEKRTKDQTYFTTGAAGSLQAVIYGFLGFRIDWSERSGAAWQIPLMDHRVLSLKPNLPSAWKSVTFKNFNVLGSNYTLIATQTAVHVTKGDQ